MAGVIGSDDVDPDRRFDDLAKANLCKLSNDWLWRDYSIKNLYGGSIISVGEDPARQLYHRSLDWAVLHCDDFQYESDKGEIDRGSFLHLVCRSGKHKLVHEIVQNFLANVDNETVHQVVNKRSRTFGRTPLHEAVSNMNVDCIEALFLVNANKSRGACSMEETDRDGRNPLHLVVARLIHYPLDWFPYEFRMHILIDRSREARLWYMRLLFKITTEHNQLQAVYTTDREGKSLVDLAIEKGQKTMDIICSAMLTMDATKVGMYTTKYNAMVRAQASICKQLLPLFIKRTMPKFEEILNLALEAATGANDLPHALETYTAAFKLKGFPVYGGLSSVPVIRKAFELACQENSPRLIRMTCKLSSREVIEGMPSDARLAIANSACGVESLDAVSVLFLIDNSLAELLDGPSLAALLKRTVFNCEHNLLILLCTRSKHNTLRFVDTDILDDVLRCALAARLEKILKNSPVLDYIGAGISQRTIEELHVFLCKELPTASPDTHLIAICIRKEVVDVCSAETCDAVANLILQSATVQGFNLDTFCESGFLSKVSLDMKRLALVVAADLGLFKLAIACIEAGALHGLRRWMSPSPVDIANDKGHDRLARMLQKALDDQNLLALGEQPVDSLLVRIGGPPGAGKSTLVKSLKTSRLRGTVRKENQPDEGIRNYLARTKGIKVHVYKDDDGTPYHVLDLGGHDDFAVAHQLFIGQGNVPIINAIVVSSLSERTELQKEMMKWCAFYASRYRAQPATGAAPYLLESVDQPQQPVVVIATRLGEADLDQRRNVIDSFGKARHRYEQFLQFQEGPLFVDARKSWAEATRALRQHLARLKDVLFKRGLCQPALCYDVQRVLAEIRRTVKGPIILRHELYQHVARALSRSFTKGVLSSHSEIFDAVLRKMSDAAEIVSFQKPGLRKYVVIEPQWLLSHIVGILMSPEHFPPPHVVYKHGRTKRSLAEAAVHNPHVPGKETLEMVAQLGLCILEEEDMIAPSKLDTRRDRETWIARADLDMYFGIRFSCECVPMSPALFPQLQVHLYNKFLDLCGQVSQLWKDGIRVALLKSNAEGLLEAQRDQMAINVAVRGSSMFPRDPYLLLQLLREQVLYVAEEFSPGSDMSMKILSSKELSALADKGSTEAPLITYKEQDVKDAMECAPRPIRSNDGFGDPEDPFYLMVLPPTHLLLLASKARMRFCSAMNGRVNVDQARPRSWRQLAKRLNLQDISDQITRATAKPHRRAACGVVASECAEHRRAAPKRREGNAASRRDCHFGRRARADVERRYCCIN